MIKRTLYFTNPAYLSLHQGQLVIEIRDKRGSPENTTTRPIEDIGLILIENRQIYGIIGLSVGAKCSCSSMRRTSYADRIAFTYGRQQRDDRAA